jgi:hypothetical protein
MTHTVVDEGLWASIQNIRRCMPFLEEDKVPRETYT